MPGCSRRWAGRSASRSLVERAVDDHRVSGTRSDRGGRQLHGRARAPATTAGAGGEAELRDPGAADHRQLVVDVHGEGDGAVDVAGREAGVGDRCRHRFARELQVAAPRVFRELGLADPDDGGVAKHFTANATGRNCGSNTPSTVSMLSRDLHAVAHVAVSDPEQVGDEADALVERDEYHHARLGVGLGRW